MMTREVFRNGSNAVSRIHIERIARKQYYRCYYCDHPMIRHRHIEGQATPRDAMTKDHYIPRAWGGPTVPKNIVAACCQCNTLRGDMDAEAFYNLMQKWFKRRPYLWVRWHQLSEEELYLLKLHCIQVHERQLRGKARRHIEFAYRHISFVFRYQHRLRYIV